MSVTTRERQVIEAALNHKPTTAIVIDRLESAEDAGTVRIHERIARDSTEMRFLDCFIR